MSGFIALYREAFTHPVLKDPERFRAWFWLVAHAAWKQTRHDARGQTIIVNRGQICIGREQLAKEWKWSPSAVERFLTRLETEHMIGRETGQRKTIITICNYDKYQDGEPEPGQTTGQTTGQKPDRNRTAKEQGNKETREEEGETRTRKSRGPYVFEGKVIKLNQADFDLWAQTYHAIPDLRAELTGFDVWWCKQPLDEQKRWFDRTSRSLNRKHQDALRAGAAPQSGNADFNDYLTQRRLEQEAWQAAGGGK